MTTPDHLHHRLSQMQDCADWCKSVADSMDEPDYTEYKEILSRIKELQNYQHQLRVKAKIKVVQMDDSGKPINVFDSGTDAALMGFHAPSIAACCKGKRKQHKGYRWGYYESNKI